MGVPLGLKLPSQHPRCQSAPATTPKAAGAQDPVQWRWDPGAEGGGSIRAAQPSPAQAGASPSAHGGRGKAGTCRRPSASGWLGTPPPHTCPVALFQPPSPPGCLAKPSAVLSLGLFSKPLSPAPAPSPHPHLGTRRSGLGCRRWHRPRVRLLLPPLLQTSHRAPL